MTLRDDLNAVADLLEREGWCQGDYAEYDANGNLTGRCLSTAIRTVQPDLSPRCEILALLRPLLPSQAGWLVAWNDDPDRTLPEVVALLRKAAGTPPTATA